ncbi:MAG: DNA polymerase III subunit alpha, partial [Anaerolineae bacterium]|nr:DNA polymerase III subunit alpha [Phycisphaerae bacterium]
CGLLKMDFLGLRTLTTLQRSIDLVKQTKNLDIDIEKVDFADKKVLELFCRGETKGIFQFESGGMQDLLMKMRPDRLEDLIAANALYRPGPMELIPTYCQRKHGVEKVPSVHPIMDAILNETYGIMVYQEQVMQIFNQLGGIELSAAYKLIKAISKKTADVIAKFQPQFIAGCVAKGIAKPQAAEIFDLILKFGGYGFNKSHSTRYAIIAFQTAYMKTYHPVEYMAALLTFEMGSTDKVVEYIEECRSMTLLDGSKGVKVLPPDVNFSDKDFTPIYVETETKSKRKSAPKTEGVIRFGMCAVRGVGEKAIEAIIDERVKGGEFRNLFDFCERVDLRSVQRGTVEALAKCGAFSSLKAHRSQLLQILDSAVEMGQQSQQDKRSGQMNIFGGAESPLAASQIGHAPPLPNVEEFPSSDLLRFEKELLGFYLTSHPLIEHQAMLERYITANTREALNMSEGVEVMLGGMLTRCDRKVAKSGRSAGQPWAILGMEDQEGKIEGMCYAEVYADTMKRYPDALRKDSIVFVRGKVDRKREIPCLIINEIFPLAEAPAKLTTAVALKLDNARHTIETLREVAPLFKKHKGNCDVFVQVETGAQKIILKMKRDMSVRPTGEMVQDIDRILGGGTVQLVGAGQRRMKRLEQQRLFKEEGTVAVNADAPIAPSDEELASAMDDEEMLV